jgi:hypothetical protein
MVEQLGPKILKTFGSIDEGLFEPVTAKVDMADDPTLIGLEGAFAFGIERNRCRCRIGSALSDGIPEELENIVVLPTLKAGAAILGLTERIEMKATAADDCQGPYQNILHQALVGQKVRL